MLNIILMNFYLKMKNKRNLINEMIRNMATHYHLSFRDVYNTLYAEFSKQSGIDIHLVYKEQPGKTKLDILEEMELKFGYLTCFYNIVQNEYNELNKNVLENNN